MQLDPFGEATPDVVEREGPLDVARDLDPLPGGQVVVNLAASVANFALHRIDFGLEGLAWSERGLRRKVLARNPTAKEKLLCMGFLTSKPNLKSTKSNTTKLASDTNENPSENAELRARENLIMILFNHNDFVTIR